MKKSNRNIIWLIIASAILITILFNFNSFWGILSILERDGRIAIINNNDEMRGARARCEGREEACFELVYPVKVIMRDRSTITVNDDDEFDKLRRTGNFIALQYPVKIIFRNIDRDLREGIQERLYFGIFLAGFHFILFCILAFFNYGDILVQTASEIPNLEFSSVANPEIVADILQDLRIEEEIEKLEGRLR